MKNKRIKRASPGFRFGSANRVGLGLEVATNPHTKQVPNIIFSRQSPHQTCPRCSLFPAGEERPPQPGKGGHCGYHGFWPISSIQQTPSYRSIAQLAYRLKTETYRGPIFGPNYLYLQAGPKHTSSAGQET